MPSVKTLYVISELYYCKRLYFFVRIGEREIIANMAANRVPLAFRAEKFRIGDNGALTYKVNFCVRHTVEQHFCNKISYCMGSQLVQGKAKPRIKHKDATWITRDGTILKVPEMVTSGTFSLMRKSSGFGARKGNYYTDPEPISKLIVPRLSAPQANDPDSDIRRDHNRRSIVHHVTKPDN